jgi:hypothetical protein
MPGKISEYTDAGTLDGDEYIEVVDSPGTTPTTKRTSVAARRRSIRRARLVAC